MNFSLPTRCRRVIGCRAIVALLAISFGPTASTLAQSPGFQSANFAGIGGQADGAQRIPAFPASPLAGGAAAMQGGEYIDVQGNPIIMPAQYCQSCPGGAYAGGACPPGSGGYGDPMAVDFGGYGEDQCGPHFFDVHVGYVALTGEELFEGLGPFTSAGVASPDFFLDPANNDAEFEPGWEITARYDVGALAVIEASYLGMYDIGFTDTVRSVDVAPGGAPFSLESIFDGFGTNAVLTPGVSQGSVHAIDYQADLQNTEINYRRYWIGHHPRITGTWMAGARYVRYTDQFQFNSEGLVLAAPQTTSLQYSGENDLVGGQLGGDAWLCLRQGLRVGVESSFGIFNNRYKFNNTGTFSADPATNNFASEAEGNQIAYASETVISFVADILPSWSLRGGYRVLYMNSLVTGANNIDQNNPNAGLVSTQGDVTFHGFHGGLEYVW